MVNEEIKIRNRYLDLIMNKDSRDRFILRSKIISQIRNYMENDGYIEVETPILQECIGGASARPFITKHNTLNRNLYLRIATELPLKKIIVGQFEKVFEIGRIFRNEKIRYIFYHRNLPESIVLHKILSKKIYFYFTIDISSNFSAVFKASSNAFIAEISRIVSRSFRDSAPKSNLTAQVPKVLLIPI